MAEQFNIDLPPRFQFIEGGQREKEEQIEDYLNRLSIQLDEMFKRLYNRVSEPISWVVRTLSNVATPSVEGGRLFLTGGTTTITNLTGGIVGQIVNILSEHAITITDGTNIFLSGSGNFVMADTDTLMLVCKADGKWYEVGRSDNT